MAFAITPNNAFNVADIEAQKAAASSGVVLPAPIYVNVGGDTFATATVIPGIPYNDLGSTAAYASNYESCVGCFDCPYSTTGARDVVYSYYSAIAQDIHVDLCESSYDTKVYVCDGPSTGIIVGCSDDECGTTPPIGWKSWAKCVHLEAGHTYYIVVDGYSSTDAGDYALYVHECIPCDVPCPPGALVEGEPTCYDNYYDSYNAGCNSTPPSFSNLPCSDEGATYTVCGTYGVYFYGGITYRDTDWYQIVLTDPATITWCATGDYDTLVGVIDGNAGCPATAFYDYNFDLGCVTTCVTNNLSAGTWWLFVSTPGWDTTWVCGGKYNATLTGFACPPDLAIEPTSWGNVKNLYR
jgi:hypothetical protein